MARELDWREKENIRLTVEIDQIRAKYEQAVFAFESLKQRYDNLDKEADWLALRVAGRDKCLFVCPHGESQTLEQCQQCFREQAREAVRHD